MMSLSNVVLLRNRIFIMVIASWYIKVDIAYLQIPTINVAKSRHNRRLKNRSAGSEVALFPICQLKLHWLWFNHKITAPRYVIGSQVQKYTNFAILLRCWRHCSRPTAVCWASHRSLAQNYCKTPFQCNFGTNFDLGGWLNIYLNINVAVESLCSVAY